MTALTDLAGECRDWSQVSIDDLLDRLEVTFAEFASEISDVGQSA
jgi:hypothetical protein